MFDRKYESDILHRALTLYTENQLDTILQKKDLNEKLKSITFSDEFEKRMEKLIKSEKRPHIKLINTAGKKAAAVLIAAALATSSVMAVPALRAPIVKIFTKEYSSFTLYTADKNSLSSITGEYTTQIKIVYRPAYIPTGYDEPIYYDSIAGTDVRFDKGDDSDQVILLSQRPLNARLSFNTEGAKIYPAEINGIFGHKCTNLGQTVYIWQEHGYFFQLVTPENYPMDEINKLIKSLAPEDYHESE